MQQTKNLTQLLPPNKVMDKSRRISTEEAKALYRDASLSELSQKASQAKERYHDKHSATYLIMGIINYTNICVAKCDYCAFYRLPHQSGGYLLQEHEIHQKIDAFCNAKVSMIGFNGGFHPGLDIHHYAQIFSGIHQKYPRLGFYDMTVAEFMFICKRSRINYAQGAQIFRKAQVKWISGGGAEILVDSFRMRHSPGKYKSEDYYQAQKAILDAGLGSTATMVIGFDETLDERIQHLERLRQFQDSMQERFHHIGLQSFLCWTYKPHNTALGGDEISLEEYLRFIAICRIYLDNFPHIRTSVLTQNHQALKAIDYGASDFDIPIEDEVTQSAGATISQDFDQILRYGESQGYSIEHRSPWKPPTTK